MQKILEDIAHTSARCREAENAVHDALDALDLGWLWGLMQTLTPESSTNHPRPGLPSTSKPTAAMASRLNNSPKHGGLGGRSSTIQREQPADALPTNVQTDPNVSERYANLKAALLPKSSGLVSFHAALDALQSAFEKAEHPLVVAANETNDILGHVERVVLPKIDVIFEYYHDNGAKLHHRAIAELVTRREKATRSGRKLVSEFLKAMGGSTTSIGPELTLKLWQIILGRGRDCLLGIYLACTLLPELGGELAKIVSRLEALMSVEAAREATTKGAMSAARPGERDVVDSSLKPVQKASVPASAMQAVDFVILTAIEVERRAVVKAFGLTEKDRVKKGTRVYWKGSVPLDNGEFYVIVIAQATDLANTDAALLTAEMLHAWSPNAALLVGIAATADPSALPIGDVVVGTEVSYYERGSETRTGARPEPKSIPADETLLNNMRSMEWSGEVEIPRPDDSNAVSRRHFGVIACGEKVIKNSSTRNKLKKSNRKILAIEMEGYGFSRAVSHSFEKVRHLDIRGVCDEASETKDDRWHAYAAAAAANLAKQFLLDRPLEPRG